MRIQFTKTILFFYIFTRSIAVDFEILLNEDSKLYPKAHYNLDFVEKELERLGAYLQTFVFDMEFNHVKFNLEKENLTSQLLYIRDAAYRISPVHPKVLGKLSFLRNMLHIMLEAADGIAWFGGQDTEHLLMRCILQLNVALLALLMVPSPNAHQIDLYKTKLGRYSESLESWLNTYKELKVKDTDLNLKFQEQFQGAKTTLNVLQEVF